MHLQGLAASLRLSTYPYQTFALDVVVAVAVLVLVVYVEDGSDTASEVAWSLLGL